MTVHPGPAAMKAGFANPAAAESKLQIRQVWAHNLEAEFAWIQHAQEHYPYVSMDTEFPGVIHAPSKHHAELTPPERYAGLKANVDALHLIQVGLAFAATAHSPPAVAFEINLREFDPRVHRHNPDSVAFLADSGIDFARNRADGVDARELASLLMGSGLVCPGDGNESDVTWVTFHPNYDFGYLVRLLTGRDLPDTLPEFLRLVRVFFGGEVYDVKHMVSRCRCRLPGSLDGLADALGVKREAGRSHQAGSDSAVTWDAFRRIRDEYFAKEGVRGFAGVLHGLEFDLDLYLAAEGDEKSEGGVITAAPATGNGSSNRPAVAGNDNSRKVAPLPPRRTRP
ncbi:hypothetical protein QYE76_050349 [Lolium multiflorum]|uniref:poly(A)-specific ribonuclease n=1 Tax=Lolium multiflorum TaxID=4521 RepID=A0AAD8SQX7_LOLMU|nr:hypothetical protein QYE76_050349 [Lolium multiflorum]